MESSGVQRPTRCLATNITMVMAMIFVFVVSGSSHSTRQDEKDYYTAAVYEHARQGDNFQDDAAAVVKANLEYYKRATELAKKQGADIILFPEYGLFPPIQNRSQIKSYLESVPDPKRMTVTPCDRRELYGDRQILYTLSCLAQKNRIVLVANMGSIERCEGEVGCPFDGDLHLNANVAFDETGKLIARYYKERLYFELAMDLPREPQDPVFDTGFGKFATFICFDSIFGKMAETSRLPEVEAVLFSTMWMNSFLFDQATQWWQAFALGNNATLLASNIQLPGYLATGSGIFTGTENSVAHTLNPDGKSKLIVAKVPRKGRGGISSASITVILKNSVVPDWTADGRDVPEVCSYEILGPAKDIHKDYRCLDHKVANFTLAKLIKPVDQLEVCNNHMCCRLDYSANHMNESYYLGIYNGTRNAFDRYFWWEEKCFLARCDDVNGTACSTFPTVSHGTLFHRVSMSANFTTEYIYPSFVTNRLRLLSLEDWTFKKRAEWSSIEMTSAKGTPLIAAALKGRVYDKDPPYIR